MKGHDKHPRFTGCWPLAFGMVLLLALFAVVPSAATSNIAGTVDGSGPAGFHQTAAVQRVVGYKEFAGKVAQVEVIIAPRPGVDPAAAAAKALQATGATVTPAWPGFLLTGHIWAEFSDHSRRNNTLTMGYNPAGDPAGGNGLVALQQAMTTWNSVPGSTFRFTFGGVTTRCSSLVDECTGGAAFLGIPGATYADGFNDLAWVRIPLPADFPGVIFGYCVTTFDPFTGEAFETDVILNTDVSPFAWETDGVSDVDVETILLHELGHALGLAHAFNEDALMYFDYTGVKRALTPSEIEGVLALYPKHPSLLSDTPSAHDFSVVAEAYTPAPGGGDFLDVFEAAGTNSRGDVAFVTNVPEGQGLFVASGSGSVRQVVRSGMAAPGAFDFGAGSADEAAINEAGQVAFCWLLGPIELPFGINGGIFLAEATGSLRAVVLPGVTAAPGGGVFVGCDTASISNLGDVAFTGFVQRGSDLEQGAFVARRDGTFVRVAGPGDQAPGGGRFSSAQFPKLAPNGGTVAFHAAVDGSPHLGVYARRGVTGSVEAIVRPGDPAPGGGTILSARGRAKVNSRGEILYGALVAVSPQIRSTELFLAGQDRTIRRIAGYGDMMPDGFRFGTLVAVWNSWTLNESGDVSFVARTDSLPMPYFHGLAIFETTAVYASTRGQLRFVAREGSVLVGLGQMFSVSPTTAPAMIDERGDVVFEVFTDAGRLLLLRAASRSR